MLAAPQGLGASAFASAAQASAIASAFVPAVSASADASAVVLAADVADAIASDAHPQPSTPPASLVKLDEVTPAKQMASLPATEKRFVYRLVSKTT